jgi:scyllo-inositol 2-dehydrogenase (NADP+)
MINVGLVGFGFAGRVFHAPIISAVAGLKLCAILERSGNDAALCYPEAQIVQSMDELLAIDEIKLVVIATPNTSHYPLAKQCLLAGRDVVVDKPFTTTYAEAADLVNLARTRGRLLTVYQNLRSNGDFRTIRRLVDSGSLGRIVLYEAHFDRYRLQIRPDAWRERAQPGSGVFFDLGVHLMDQAMVLFGLPEAITADIRIERAGAVVDDAFDVTMHYPRNRVLVRASMIALAPDIRYIVRGESGAFIKCGIDPQEAALKRGEFPRDETWGREAPDKWGTLYTPEGNSIHTEPITTIPGDYRLFYANVREAILGKAQIDVTHEQMLNVMYALESARESSGRRCTMALQRR